MKILRDRSTPENSQYWDFVERVAKEVDSWPAWMKGVREDKVYSKKDCLAALEEIWEYFDDREDVVDGAEGEPRPNREMQLKQETEAVIAAVKKRMD